MSADLTRVNLGDTVLINTARMWFVLSANTLHPAQVVKKSLDNTAIYVHVEAKAFGFWKRTISFWIPSYDVFALLERGVR